MAVQQASGNPITHRFTGKERVEVGNWVLVVRDAYNLVYAYTMIHDWIVEEGWGPRDDKKFPETFYLQRENPVTGKELWFRWRLSKSGAGLSKSSLFSYTMDLDFHVVGLKDTEIAWKGQKVKADRSEFELSCRAAVLIDKSHEWKTWPFSAIKDIMVNRVKRSALDMHKASVYKDAYRLRDLVANYMKVETFMPTKEVGEFFSKRTLE